jgi:hypothetical protein
MGLVYWISAVVTGLIGSIQAFRYTQTPNRTNLALGSIFLLACGCLVYLGLTTKA